jgi:hypothetical protein
MTPPLLIRPRRRAALAFAVLSAALAAGCSSAAAPAPVSPSPASAATSLTGSLTTASGTWAVVVIGNPASQANAFWQLFTLPSGSTQWSLVTPPGVASNGGLVVAADTGSPGTLRVAFRPSQNLTFSPLASTSNSGRTWAPGVLGAGIADVPDALAARGTTMLALLADGTIDHSATSGTSWGRLTAAGTITASAAGRRCQVTALTAVALTPSGTPLAGAACATPGSAGIFAYIQGTWQATGPAPGALPAGQPSRVLRLTSTPAGNTALIMTGTGGQARLSVAWTSDGSLWTASPPLQAGGGQIRASGTGADGLTWVLLGDGHAAVISGPGGSWQTLPALPAGTAALAAVGGGAIDALTVAGGDLTVFQLPALAGGWTRTQVINVPIQPGSSS